MRMHGVSLSDHADKCTWSGYWEERERRLLAQDADPRLYGALTRRLAGGQLKSADSARGIFQHCCLYFDGRVDSSSGLSSYTLGKLARLHGAEVTPRLTKRRVTHVVCAQLSGAKEVRALAGASGGRGSAVLYYVVPQWVTQSVAARKRLCERRFSLLASVAKGVGVPMLESSSITNGDGSSHNSRSNRMTHTTRNAGLTRPGPLGVADVGAKTRVSVEVLDSQEHVTEVDTDGSASERTALDSEDEGPAAIAAAKAAVMAAQAAAAAVRARAEARRRRRSRLLPAADASAGCTGPGCLVHGAAVIRASLSASAPDGSLAGSYAATSDVADVAAHMGTQSSGASPGRENTEAETVVQNAAQSGKTARASRDRQGFTKSATDSVCTDGNARSRIVCICDGGDSCSSPSARKRPRLAV